MIYKVTVWCLVFSRDLSTFYGRYATRYFPGVCTYLDDLLITCKNDHEHKKTLEAVLQRLSDAGARLMRAKCVFEVPESEYLGHLINALGLHPTEEKVRAIKEAPAPKTLQELRSFLGMLNFYGKFIPNLSAILAPLNVLLRKNTEFTWNTPQQKAFNMAKQCLISAPVLVHYDSEKDIVVYCDTSPYGLGAVIAHKFDDGTEKPIAFASRTLTSAETRYSQLDKEALAVIFASKKNSLVYLWEKLHNYE